MLVAAGLAGLGVSAANAALVVDVRLPGSGGNSLFVTTGQVVPMEIWARITPSANGNGLVSLSGSLISSNGGILANLTAARDSNWDASGSQAGTIQDLDGDTDLDIGSNTPSSATGYWAVRADSAPNPVPGDSFLIGTVTATVGALNGATTVVSFRPRGNGNTHALWLEGGVVVNPSTSQFLAGDGVTLFIPEPASLGLAGIAGLGLLARRRQA